MSYAGVLVRALAGDCYGGALLDHRALKRLYLALAILAFRQARASLRPVRLRSAISPSAAVAVAALEDSVDNAEAALSWDQPRHPPCRTHLRLVPITVGTAQPSALLVVGAVLLVAHDLWLGFGFRLQAIPRAGIDRVIR